MRLSVVIPVYNEVATVQTLVDRVMDVNLEKEIIIVDDGSTDGTREVLRSLEGKEGVSIFYREANRGKGAALRDGFRHVTGEIVIIQDADLEYEPQEYPSLIAPILDGRADVVYGSRFLGGPHRVFFFWHYLGNKLLTLLSNMINNLNLTDMETCYKVFRTPILRQIEIKSDSFGVDPELTAKIARMGCRIYETPISYSGRDYSEGKKITWRDGIIALWCVFRIDH